MKIAGLFLVLCFASLGLRADQIVLKDHQKLDGDVKGFDAYFLDAQNSKGTLFHIPWSEVQSVSHTSTVAAPDEANHLDPNPAPVHSLVTPAFPAAAFQKALFPGIIIHGWGHREAQAIDTYYTLLGVEAFSLGLAGFGLSESLGPDTPGESKVTANTMSIVGGSLFIISWVYDLAFAPSAARQFNQEHGLAMELVPLEGKGGMLALNCRY